MDQERIISRSGDRFGPDDQPTARVLIETFDHDGTLMRSSVRSVPLMSHNANLFDMGQKYADLLTAVEIMSALGVLSTTTA